MIPKKSVFRQGLAIEHEGTLRTVFYLSGCFCVCWGCGHVFLIVGLNGRSKNARLEVSSTLCPLDNLITAAAVVVVVVVVEDDALLRHVW